MTGVDDNGIGAYRDTLVRLPDPTDDDWVPFDEIDEAWVLVIAEKTAEENNWKESIVKEIEAAKSRPVTRPFSFQVVKKEG